MRSALDRGWLLAICVLALYAWVAPAHIVDGDNAEFATLGALGGAAHPSGYPLYVLLLRATSWLPGATAAHTAALATALIAACSILVLHAACRAWGARPLAATITCAIFAAAPLVIRGGTRAEVFALNNLAVAAVLWLAAAGGPLRGKGRALALGAVAGLGLANHMTCSLVAPVGLLGIVRAIREIDPSRERTMPTALVVVGLAVAGLVVGLSPYAYLLVAPDTPMSWGTVRDLDGLVGHVLRRDYGGPGAFVPREQQVAMTDQLAALGLTFGRTWLWAPLALGLWAWARAIAKPREEGVEPRWGWILLAGSWLVAGPLLVLKFNIPPEGLGLYVVQRFHVLPAMLLALPIAVGLSSLLPTKRETTFNTIASTLGFVAIAALALPHIRRVHTPAIERYARNVLRTAPPNAVLFAGQDDEYFGMGYVQWALGERRDVAVVAWQLTIMPWYGKRLATRGVFAPAGDGPALIRVVDYLLKEGRPVFVEKRRANAAAAMVIEHFTTYPVGTLMRVLPRGTPTPSIDIIVAENKAVYSQFQLGYAHPGTDDEFATAVHLRYASTWQLLARKLVEAGKRDDAAWAAELAQQLAPRD